MTEIASWAGAGSNIRFTRKLMRFSTIRVLEVLNPGSRCLDKQFSSVAAFARMRKVAKRPAFLRMRQRLEIAQKVMAANATSEAPATEPQRNLRFSPCRPSRLSKMRWTRHPMPHKRCGPLTLEWGAGFPKCGGGGI